MKYIAYGSNMNLEQMAYRCPGSKVVCNGKLYGWKLVFKLHADIVYTGDLNDVVPVVVWEIAREDWKNLDRYEGYPRYYIKKTIDTHMADGRVEGCIAYVMTDIRKDYIEPENYYVNTILIGCRENGIDGEYIYDALKEARKKNHRPCEW